MIQDHEHHCDECGHILPIAGPCLNCGKRPPGTPIYVAGAYADRERVTGCMRMARDAGLHVVHDWISIIDNASGKDEDLSDEEAERHAEGDCYALHQARVLWFVTPPEGRGRGSWWEGGVAWRAGIPIVASGPHVRGSVFTALGLRFERDSTALKHIVFKYGGREARDRLLHADPNAVCGMCGQRGLHACPGADRADRLAELEHKVDSIDCAIANMVSKLGERIDRLENLAASARALGHVEGRQGRGAPRPGGEDSGGRAAE